MDDWDDGERNIPVSSNFGVASEGGKKFSSGRGFKAVQHDIEDEWGNGYQGNFFLVCPFINSCFISEPHIKKINNAYFKA